MAFLWVPDEESPGGKLLTARRHLPFSPIFGFLDELPGGDEHPPDVASHFWLDFDVSQVLGGF